MDNNDNRPFTIDELNEMIERLIDDEDVKNRDSEIMCGLVLLAEAYAERKEYERVDGTARNIGGVIDDFNIPDDLKIKVLQRTIKALEPTPYHHRLREFLAMYVKTAAKAGIDTDGYRDEAEKLVKLDILLEPDTYREKDKDLEEILSSLFTSAELIRMIESPLIGFLEVDRIEYTWRWEEIANEVEAKVEKILAGKPRGMGFCHLYWSVKTDILKDEYGIEWHSPAVMNPRVLFD